MKDYLSQIEKIKKSLLFSKKKILKLLPTVLIIRFFFQMDTRFVSEMTIQNFY